MRTFTFEEYQKYTISFFEKINDLFKQNNINWFAHSGTLLGAARYKNIIPWDDDYDMGMEYYHFKKNKQKIKKLLEENFPGVFELIDPFPVFHKWKIDVAVIRFKDYVLLKTKWNEFPFKFKGSIDIMLGCSPRIKPWRTLKSLNGISLKSYNWKDETESRTRKFIQRILLPLIFIYSKYLTRFTFWTAKSKQDSLSLIYSFSWRKDIYKFEQETFIRFGNTDLPVPSNWDEVLKNSFGDDYIVEPSIDKQKPHHVLNFSKPQKK